MARKIFRVAMKQTCRKNPQADCTVYIIIE